MFLTKQFIENTLRDDGWTMFLSNEKYTGYIVAESGIVIGLDEFKRGSTLTQFINNAYDNGYDVVGTWINEGVVYLDRCVYFERFADADNFARKNNQLAFYNIGGDFVIFC